MGIRLKSRQHPNLKDDQTVEPMMTKRNSLKAILTSMKEEAERNREERMLLFKSRSKARLPKWFGERPGKKKDDPGSDDEGEPDEELEPPPPPPEEEEDEEEEEEDEEEEDEEEEDEEDEEEEEEE